MSDPQLNAPDLWRDRLPWPRADANKYDRGHAMIFAAGELTGATRLAAGACSRIGAGLVTVIAPDKADLFRAVLPADIMVREKLTPDVRRISAVLAGPGGSVPDAAAQGLVPAAAFRVFDAGALPKPGDHGGLDARCVLTPHDGEFARAFPGLDSCDRAERAMRAAAMCGAIVVLKGSETVIAAPGGRLAVNRHASPFLAKAGTGDVLAGMIAGLLAQADSDAPESAFDLACAAVWIHGEAGRRLGPGLTAADLEGELPAILRALYKYTSG